MGLGSKDDAIRKEFKTIAGKTDWKSKVKTASDASNLIKKIEETLSQDPNGKLIMCMYVGGKIEMLKRYIADVGDRKITLKEYLNGKKS